MPGDAESFCEDHKICMNKIEILEKSDEGQWKKIDNISTKLNFILGGVIISPFFVALLTLLIKARG